jgi:hypothetical protein
MGSDTWYSQKAVAGHHEEEQWQPQSTDANILSTVKLGKRAVPFRLF